MKLFWSFARQNFHALAAYRFDFLLRASSIIILMYGIRWLWVTLYTQRPGAFGVSLQQMVTYGVLSMAIQNLFYTDPPYYMARQVRTGAIDLDLLKPIDFHFHMLARSMGEMLFRVFVLALPGLLIGYLLFDLHHGVQPATTGHGQVGDDQVPLIGKGFLQERIGIFYFFDDGRGQTVLQDLDQAPAHYGMIVGYQYSRHIASL